jgi:hypothetical protein
VALAAAQCHRVEDVVAVAAEELGLEGESVRNGDIKEKQHTLCTFSTGAAIGSGLVLTGLVTTITTTPTIYIERAWTWRHTVTTKQALAPLVLRFSAVTSLPNMQSVMQNAVAPSFHTCISLTPL